MGYVTTAFFVSKPPVLPDSWDSVVLPVDKPGGITSFDVLRRLKRILGRHKMGHAGTLDPMATGLLLCLIGRATKLMRHFLEVPKVYTGRIRLGEATASYDADTPVTERTDAAHVTSSMVREIAADLVGPLRQHTPLYSAVRVGGERLYRKARRGESVATPTRDVTVYSFDIEREENDDFTFTLSCSSGTYVRSIAHEIGTRLGVGAHLIALRRLRIGEIDVAEAWNLESISQSVGASHPGGTS